MGSAERRSDSLLRAVVEALQQEGYTLVDRGSAEKSNSALFHRERTDASTYAEEFVLVTHESARHSLRADLYRADVPGGESRPGRTVYEYYHPYHKDNLADIARALAARVAGR